MSKLNIQLRNEWKQIGRDCSWYNITLLDVSGEWDKAFGYIHFTSSLLGLGFQINYQYTETKMMKDILKIAKKKTGCKR